MSTLTTDSARLLNETKRHRLVLEATLMPVSGARFQPAGFPEIGHVIYDAPGANQRTQKVCIVDSAASMANHLEAVMHESPQTLELHPDLNGMPYVRCLTDEGWPNVTKVGPHRLVVTSLSEGHRLASSYFTDERSQLVVNAKPSGTSMLGTLREGFGMPDLGKRSHPLPGDWWNVFRTIFHYDPNSLVHGILFPALGIKIPRVLTAHHEAFGSGRVETSGVKFDKLGKTTSGQPIFAKSDVTAETIRATFVIDLALLRSFGRGNNGLSDKQKQFLLELALWKIGRLVENSYRYRSGCLLELSRLTASENGTTSEVDASALGNGIADAITSAAFRTENSTTSVLTDVYWPAEQLFKEAKEASTDTGADEESGTETT